MFVRLLSVTVVVCAVLGLAFAGLNTARAEVLFCLNPGFEDNTYVAGRGGNNYGTETAQPWSWWDNQPLTLKGIGPTNGAIANPVADANNSSPRVWANWGKPDYVSVASQNNGSMRPNTGFWMVPGASYRFHMQVYVPSTVLRNGVSVNNLNGWDGAYDPTFPAGLPNVTPRAGMYLAMGGTGLTPAQPTTLRPLDPRFYENAGVEPPLPIFVPQQSPVSPNVIPDQWNTFDVDYVFPTTWNTFDANGVVTGTYNTVPQFVNYPSFRLYGGDGRYLNTATGTPPAKPLVAVPNIGGYFDNCQISSEVYRNDLFGFVRDGSGVPIEGATVTLSSPFSTTLKDVVTTAADGRYALPTWAPYGYTFSVSATKDGVTLGDGPVTLLVSATANQFPNIGAVPEPSTLVLLAAGVLGLAFCGWRRRK